MLLSQMLSMGVYGAMYCLFLFPFNKIKERGLVSIPEPWLRKQDLRDEPPG